MTKKIADAYIGMKPAWEPVLPDGSYLIIEDKITFPSGAEYDLSNGENIAVYNTNDDVISVYSYYGTVSSFKVGYDNDSVDEWKVKP